ncbi:MAG: ZIP family metal transporter [Gemmatimonadota bacterium]|nr:ZIP family metal transporter [Gemmatimonadota bacterium]
MDTFAGLHPVWQALIAGGGTWAITAAGAALVFLTTRVPQRLLDAMLGFAAGVMLAASIWSLLLPAIEIAGRQGRVAWLPAAVGFLAGGAALRLADFFIPHLHPGLGIEHREGVDTAWERTTLLVMAITLHNIPEGLAVGVAFGAAAGGIDVVGEPSLSAAIALAIGIAIQNFPEGVAVAMPLRREGVTAGRSFWYGQLSAIVEPVAAVLGALAVLAVGSALPFLLSFAAGAMIFVVVEELIPESQHAGNPDLATAATLVGFVVMMILDVALG